jgi:hypothetical protein
MATEWFCKIMGEVLGPMSAEELIAIAHWGRLNRDDVVRKGATGTWVRAETVDGLLQAPAPAATATSGRVAVSKRQPLPARRSIRQVEFKQYWVKVGLQIAGPFSEVKLRHLAEKGKLKTHYLVSEDRCRWVRADGIKDLDFGSALPEQPATVSVRATVWPLPAMRPRPAAPEGHQVVEPAYAEMAAR